MIETVAAVGAGAGYGAANFLGGLAASRQPVLVTLLVSQTAALFIVGTAATALPVGPGTVEQVDITRGAAVGAAAGVAAAAGAYLAYACFRSAQLGVSAALLSIAQVAVPVAAGAAGGTVPFGVTLAGLSLATSAAVLLGWPRPGAGVTTGPRTAALAVGAGAAFGSYHSIMAAAPQKSGLWPVVSAETVIVLLAGVALLARRTIGSRRSPGGVAGRRAMGLAAGDGVTSAVATVAGLTAVRGAALPVAGAVIAVVPAGVTVLLARFVLRQRLGPRLTAGVAVAAAAVVLLTACTGDPDQPDPTPSGLVGPSAPTALCSGALPGGPVVDLLGPGRIRESGVPQVPQPRSLVSQCELLSGNRDRTLTLVTAAAEVTGRSTLQGIANNSPATAVPIAADATGLLDPTFGWLARPCAERRTLLTSLRLSTDAGSTPAPAPADQRRTLAALLLGAADRAATAAECDRGTTPPAGPLPAQPTPAPVADTACGAPAAALGPVTGTLAGWTVTAPAADTDAAARTCDLAGPDDARIRFVVSRGIVATNAGTLVPGTDAPVAGLPGASAGPDGGRLDTTCRGTPVAYRLHLDALPRPARTTDVAGLLTVLVRASTTTAGCR